MRSFPPICKRPLSAAISTQFARGVTRAVLCAAVAGTATPSFAQFELEEVIVTATKRATSLQDTPVSIVALTGSALEDLGITNFDEYALMLPSVSYSSSGPGQSQVYMRGAADGGDGNASGSQPSVAIYLDEQPVTAIGRNLDLHVYDIERVEALAGPQSTLFGASSQSGTLRIITNKPQMEEFEAGFDLSASTTKSGDPSYVMEGYVNQPLSDSAALRLVVWNKEDGGYIDNIAGNRQSWIYDNGNSTIISENNSARVKENFNDLSTQGLRAAVKVDLNEDWSATVSYLMQDQDAEGVWFHDPENPNGEVGELQVQRFGEDSSADEFKQAGLTLEGDLGFASLVYAGSFMDRDVVLNTDYSDYSDYNNSSWITYASCDYYYAADSACTSMSIFYSADNNYQRDTHEIRLQSQLDGDVQFVVGAYMEESTHTYRQEWHQPGMAKGSDFALFDEADLWYLTDQVRSDEQTAIFGEVTFQISDVLSATLGGRYFETESDLQGVTGYGTQTMIDWGYATLDVDTKADDSGSIYKANLNYSFGEDDMVYATYSEGYRPGGINRDETAVVSRTYEPDYIANFEFGWKTQWLDNRLRWNGAAYHMSWTDMQHTRYDLAQYGSPVGLTVNVTEAEINGVETDITFLIREGWTVAGGMAYNNAESTKAFAIGGKIAPVGTRLPNVPKLKFNLNSRYNFELANQAAYVQAVYAFVDESYDSLFAHPVGDASAELREKQIDYTTVNLSAGIENDAWGIDLFVDNLLDERAELTRGAQGNSGWDSTITANRPRTLGIKYKMQF
jgi:outer membrane receptor protein involved in Fe transport